MGANVVRGRVTAAYRGELVVFLIGMRVNRWRAVRRWWPVFLAMPPMLREIAADPDSGYLGGELMFGPGPRAVTLVQYWRGTDELFRYAADPERRHHPAWREFNRRVRECAGAVGVWHETYRVAATEQVYVDMPPFGLGRVVGVEPVARRGDRAAERIDTGE